MNEDEKKEHMQKKKKRILGNVNFIGELYLVNIISLKIITIVTSSMFDNFLTDYYVNIDNAKEKLFTEFELVIEGILTLFDKIGKNLEKEKEKTNQKNAEETAKKSEMVKLIKEVKDQVRKFTQDRNALPKDIKKFGDHTLSVEEIFDLLEFIREMCKITNRVRCLIENLTERRRLNWADRLFANEGPKKLDELQKEHQKELDSIDQRAEEFYKTESFESKSKGSQNRQSNAGFQVATGQKEDKKAESKKDSKPVQQSAANYNNSNVSFNVNLDFNANRGSAPKSAVSLSKTIPPHEIEERLKEVFKKWQDGFEKKEGQEDIKYDDARAYSDIESTFKLSNPQQFVDRFLFNYYDTKLTELEKRNSVLIKLTDDKHLKSSEFIHPFSTFINKKAWEIMSDYPGLSQSLAKIYSDFVQKTGIKFQDIELMYWRKENKEFDEDSIDFVLDFYQEFISHAEKLNPVLENFRKKTAILKELLNKGSEDLKVLKQNIEKANEPYKK